MVSHQADRPPLPRFVARIGVTGHRPNNACYPAPGLETAISTALRRVDEAVRAAHDTHRDAYSSDLPIIRMISGLAEGADHLAAALRPEPWRLDAILPMPVDLYRTDFTAPDRRVGTDALDLFDADLRQASSVLELPVDPNADDPMCYARQGLLLARQIDLLVALWDGAPARGLGGTADVVAFAREEDVPVVWIPLTADTPALLLDSSTAQDLGQLPDRLATIFDVHETQGERSPTPASPHEPFEMAGADRWTDLLSRIGHAGAFGERLRRAAAPLLDHAIHRNAEDLADAVRTAILLLPAVALTNATTKPWMSQPARSRLAALVREVGLPSTLIDADYIDAHCEHVAETVAAPWPERVARLRAIAGQPSLDLVWLELTGIASDLLNRRCGLPQRRLTP